MKSVSKVIGAEDTWSDGISPESWVHGINIAQLNVSVADNSGGNTIQIQRQFPDDADSAWRTVTDQGGDAIQWTGNVETRLVDMQPGVKYRIGCPSGGYVSGSPVVMLGK
jgi:hypothetical protein